jgi:hypothetical protein
MLFDLGLPVLQLTRLSVVLIRRNSPNILIMLGLRELLSALAISSGASTIGRVVRLYRICVPYFQLGLPPRGNAGAPVSKGAPINVEGRLYKHWQSCARCRRGHPANPRKAAFISALPRLVNSGNSGARISALRRYDAFATFLSKSTFRFKAITRPSTPSRCRMEWNSDRCTASWLIEPSRYTSEIRRPLWSCRIR